MAPRGGGRAGHGEREESERDVFDADDVVDVDRNSAPSKKRKYELDEREGGCSCCGSAVQSTRSRETGRDALSLSLSLTRARFACELECPARLSGERRSERKRKKNRVDFCRSRCFAFPRLSFTSPSRPSLLPLLIVFLHFHCSLLLFFFREPGPRERARDLSLSLSL